MSNLQNEDLSTMRNLKFFYQATYSYLGCGSDQLLGSDHGYPNHTH